MLVLSIQRRACVCVRACASLPSVGGCRTERGPRETFVLAV